LRLAIRGIAISRLSDQHRTGRLRAAVTENRGASVIQLLVEPVEPHCSASHHPALGLRRHSFEALHHHFGRAGEKAIRVGVVSRP
jgi:hypothetical protein